MVPSHWSCLAWSNSWLGLAQDRVLGRCRGRVEDLLEALGHQAAMVPQGTCHTSLTPT